MLFIGAALALTVFVSFVSYRSHLGWQRHTIIALGHLYWPLFHRRNIYCVFVARVLAGYMMQGKWAYAMIVCVLFVSSNLSASAITDHIQSTKEACLYFKFQPDAGPQRKPVLLSVLANFHFAK